MEVPVHDIAGKVVKNINVDDAVFAVPFNEPLVHQAVLRQQANARHGNADTKTRAEVAGSKRKLFHQKGTGEARASDNTAPHRYGGGVVFGPTPRSYVQAMPRKMHQLALKCAISSKVSDGSLLVIEEFKIEQPKTREIAAILAGLGIESTALVVTNKVETNLVKSARNLPHVKTIQASLLNVLDLMTYDRLVMTESAVRKAEETWGGNKEKA